MPYIHTEEQRQQELDMMRTPDRWPIWPKLPLKRPMDEYEQNVGLLVSTDALGNEPPQPTVYLVNLFEKFSFDGPKIEYGSMEELVDDGWVVD